MISIYNIDQIPVDLRNSMHADRKALFGDRLGWPVNVDEHGREYDQYDDGESLYIVASEDGRHTASMRLRSTLAPTMINDHFAHLLPDGPIIDPYVWEVTRYCAVQSQAGLEVSMMSHVFAQCHHLVSMVAVIDKLGLRLHNSRQNAPVMLGAGPDGNCAVYWPTIAYDLDDMCRALGVSLVELKRAHMMSTYERVHYE